MWNAEICLKKIYRASLSTLSMTYIQKNKKKFSELFCDSSEAIAKLETISTHLNQQTYSIQDLKKELSRLESYNINRKNPIVNSILYLQNYLKSFYKEEIENLDDSSKEFLDLLKIIKISGEKVDVHSDSGESVGGSSFDEVNDSSSDEELNNPLDDSEFDIVGGVEQVNIADASNSQE